MKTSLLAIGALAASVLMAVPAFAEGWTPAPPVATDVVVGSQDAPVTVYEYASFTCPHCARFHTESADAFIRDYVETGKARLVIRHLPLDRSALGAALAVACMPEGLKLRSVGAFFRDIDAWAADLRIAPVVAGLVDGDMAALEGIADCMAGQDLAEGIMSLAADAIENGVDGTPAFVVEGDIHVGFRTASELGALVDEASGR